jgi:hypothetical protein
VPLRKNVLNKKCVVVCEECGEGEKKQSNEKERQAILSYFWPTKESYEARYDEKRGNP